jgi:hypothetical protein
MKRLLLVMVSAMAFSAFGQAVLDGSPAAGKQATRKFSGTIEIPNDPSHLPDFTLHEFPFAEIAHRVDGCPVEIVTATFERPAQLMFAYATQQQRRPTLRLEYRNSSGKDISTVVLTGWLKIKENPYQLDFSIYPIQLKLSRDTRLGKDVQKWEALQLASDTFGLDRLVVDQVQYLDGTTWKRDRQSCTYSFSKGSVHRAEAR